MFTIRKATVADCELIHKMAKEVFPATYKEILSPEQLDYMMDWMYAPSNVRKQMEEEGHVYSIAYKENEPCGYVSIQQQEKDVFHLQKIYVLPRFQGTHCGSFLFKEAIKCIKEIHPEPCLMELNVNRNNKALQFYEHMGMRKLREGDFPIGNGYYMNDYIMGLDILYTKLLQKSEMRKNMVMDLIYRGFIYAANYSESHYNPRRSQIKTELRYLFVTTPNR